MKSTIRPIVLLVLAAHALGATYRLADNITGPAFFDAFGFEATADPSHGRVNYVNRTVAQQLNLTFATSNTFIMRSEFKTTLSPTGPGRSSVRLRSVKTYTTHAAIFDVRHMPQGCGTWPAIWEVKESAWPTAGEVDIMEGVNNVSPNAATLHTNAGCTMPTTRNQTGTSTALECNTLVNGAGCGVKFPTAASFGPPFNTGGGGWFAIERTTTFIKVWFWPRNSASMPPAVKAGDTFVTTESWGVPTAYFPDTSCNMTTHFHEHNIIINLTFCGDFAGSAYKFSGCPSTCVDFVNNNPSQFGDAYFDFASVKVYT